MKNTRSLRKELKTSIQRGGSDPERLYLEDFSFKGWLGTPIHVKKTSIPKMDTDELIAACKGRYAMLGAFLRPNSYVLDFPCGSGYAAEFFNENFGVSNYQGLDSDCPTLDYARHLYGEISPTTVFVFARRDMANPQLELEKEEFDVIACVEGIEHIDWQFQKPLIKAFHYALKPGGTLLVTSPENVTGKSGRSTHNKFHKWELSRADFEKMLKDVFGHEPGKVEIVTTREPLSTGVTTNCFYGFCHKI